MFRLKYDQIIFIEKYFVHKKKGHIFVPISELLLKHFSNKTLKSNSS